MVCGLVVSTRVTIFTALFTYGGNDERSIPRARRVLAVVQDIRRRVSPCRVRDAQLNALRLRGCTLARLDDVDDHRVYKLVRLMYAFAHIREFYSHIDKQLVLWDSKDSWAFWSRVAYGNLSKDGLRQLPHELIERYALSNQSTLTHLRANNPPTV